MYWQGPLGIKLSSQLLRTLGWPQRNSVLVGLPTRLALNRNATSPTPHDAVIEQTIGSTRSLPCSLWPASHLIHLSNYKISA